MTTWQPKLQRHSVEPWRLDEGYLVAADGGLIVWAEDDGRPYGMHLGTIEWENEKDRPRIVACVNALTDINPVAVPLLLDASKGVRWLIEDWLANNDASSEEGEECEAFIAALRSFPVGAVAEERNRLNVPL
ncbi:hypothetical protein LCGC14_1253960 [marine sediment metagenome]|uniref:Uncharacterized protein n=1 Tax=marine sediment metagenome TaxID=412755 RepID=A0A0F9P649_9ZZZZ